ncbi:hypothetical protein Ciccas_003894 [Cichlidogyrus casuarinus]|uniref:Uncharacterized protein n=1 Tax=Cichlidogyrus casuarinus TaxID=1844966 RepID=A0ABD2QD39_9PLAT
MSVITVDPISGIGLFRPEHDPLAGSHIKRKCPNTRNPITLTGYLPECDYLYDSESVKTRPREARDIICLRGDLGEEANQFRNRSRNYSLRKYRSLAPFNFSANRNPITGEGNFGREWDPIYKYRGQLRRNRPAQLDFKRDPITHSVPLINMGENSYKTGLRITQRDPTVSNRDLLTHREKSATPEKSSFMDRIKNTCKSSLEYQSQSRVVSKGNKDEQLESSLRKSSESVIHSGGKRNFLSAL